MDTITAATTAAAATLFTMNGAARICAGPLTDGQTVTIHEEYPDGEYYPAKVKGVQIQLTKSQGSEVFEGYGNYKAVISETGIDVGIEKAS